MSSPTPAPPSAEPESRQGGYARRVTIGLEALTAVGAAAGVQGFLSGAFDPLVDQLREAWSVVDGPVLPAAALGVLVGLPQAGAVILGLRHDTRAPVAGLAVGAVLAGWVLVQLPLIGWGSPVQWAFAAIGLGEVASARAWLRSSGHRPGPTVPGHT